MLRQGLGFLLVGGLNTAITYGLYCLLVIWWHPQLAWLAVFLIGIGLKSFRRMGAQIGAKRVPLT